MVISSKIYIEMRELEMKTVITDKSGIDEAVKLIQEGEVVAFPTETVYGLGANALDEEAVQKIFRAKGRPNDNPLNALVASKKALYMLVESIPAYVDQLIDVFSPGPITYILPSANKVATSVSANLPTVGVRIPNHPIALAILEQSALPIAAPSANVSGRPSPTTAKHVVEDLDGKIAAIVDGGATNYGLESTVVDCTGEIPIILRSGMITANQIESVVGACQIAPHVTANSHKYKHYTPDVPLYIAHSEMEFNELIQKETSNNNRIGVIVPYKHYYAHKSIVKEYILGNQEEEMAHNLYDILRSLNKSEVDIVISTVFPSPIIMDRLSQAATTVK